MDQNTLFNRNVKENLHQGRKAQFSFEYIVVIAVIIGLFVPLSYVFFNKSEDLEEETVRTQLEIITQQIMAHGEQLYYSSGYSKRTIKKYFPAKITSFSINGKEIVYTFRTTNGDEDIVYFSPVPIYMPFPVEGAAVQNLHSIFMARQTVDDVDQTVLLCTNINQESPCDTLAESSS